MIKGECLCGEVQFEILAALPNLYQCHCSLCRKATGAAANAATFASRENFRWTSGHARVKSFSKSTGYRSDFCSVCGSPVPNSLGDTQLMWIPAGLLPDEFTAEIAVHLHLASSAPWEREAASCLRLDAGPDSLSALSEALKPGT
ncbi:GFA family protein [Hydrocarboniclastica marina]|uniref:GFA family protein n=1 Tax=Hydrocarboniclastica marina TaxID=2259620 RepID=UPI001C12B45F|nr:GFA family protein [Hydrocarboniclastica marina]|tara:strand:- start:719 stop:1153 length:435 start_codon:yes stop_codon:yes gene_type:complete